MPKSVVLALALVAGSSFVSAAHADCKNARTLPEYDACAKAEFTEAQKKMNFVLRNNIYGSSLFDAKLGKATQTLFLSYVDSHCAFEGATLLKGGGDRAQLPSFVMKCKARMYNGRVTLFSTMLSGG